MLPKFVRLSIPVLLGLTLSQSSFLSGQDVAGKTIYSNQCASCHGEKGQGVEGKYKQSLTGDLTVESLAEVIEGTMPDQDPDLCVAEDADAVAKYIYEAFYSPAAQARQATPLELTHRTNLQYKNAIADLAARFSGKIWINEGLLDRGMKGKYYSSRNFDTTKSMGERVDPKIEFDFGSGSPFSPEVEMEEFGIQWFAALKVEETGLYDFFVDSPNGIRLFVNDPRTPVIDAWVSTGGDEHEASVYLLGGHYYLVKLEMFKYQEDAASISFKWRPPHGKLETVPTEKLLPMWAPLVVVSDTVLPPDDSSTGYPRGTSVSKAWLEATSESAIQFANRMLSDQEKYFQISKDDPEKEEKLKKFCRRLAKFAFSRPLSEEQLDLYVNSQFESAESSEAAARQSIILTLSSPRFLYPELGVAEPDDYLIASRLALLFWDSIPDQELWSAASGANLSQTWGIQNQLDRMLDDPRTRAKIRGFFHHWLEMNSDDLTKDKELYPEFNKEIAMDLRRSLELFLDDVVWTGNSDYRRLYESNEIYVSELMADYYKIQPPTEGFVPEGVVDEVFEDEVATSVKSPKAVDDFDGFKKVELATEQRAGILTHPYLMTELAYHRTTSPIHRGVFVARRLIGRALKQPPENFEPLKEDFDPTMTTRERVAHQTKDSSCMTCHSFINPLGFSLEGFDAVGNIRETEKDKPIDSSSLYSSETDQEYSLTGAKDLANYLVDSEKVQRNFIKHLFQHLVKHPPRAYGTGTLDLLHQSFVQNEFSIKILIKDIAKITALHGTEAAAKLEVVKPEKPAAVTDDTQPESQKDVGPVEIEAEIETEGGNHE
jgi:cytochrome c553